MRLPRITFPLKSAVTRPLLRNSNDSKVYACITETKSNPKQSIMSNPKSVIIPPFANGKSLTPTGAEKPSDQVDPLDLVIEKRKRKELADPVIAEAIISASKLPPPRVPEAENEVDLPIEIQRLIAFGFHKTTDDSCSVEFLRNYPLHKPPIQPSTKSALVSPKKSRCEILRQKCLASTQRFRKSKDYDGYGDDEDDDDDEYGATDGEDATAEKSLISNAIHSDDDWFMESVLHVFCLIMIVLTLPLSLMFCLKVVAHYERAVLFRLGRLVSATAQGPGLIIVLPCLDRFRILDLRTFTFDVPTQEVLTKDSVTVVVNAVVYYRVRDPVRAVVNVEDANRATRVLGQTTLRNVLGTVNLDQLLTAREDIAALMQECLDSVTEAWGVKVERVEIKDVRLPIQLQRAMAAEAESVREATAKVIAAEGERRAAGALKAAAFEIRQHPFAMQLRYLQAVNSISSGKESTIIFPVPLDLHSFFSQKTGPASAKAAKAMLTNPLGASSELLFDDGDKLMEHVRASIGELQHQMSFQDDDFHSADVSAQIV